MKKMLTNQGTKFLLVTGYIFCGQDNAELTCDANRFFNVRHLTK